MGGVVGRVRGVIALVVVVLCASLAPAAPALASQQACTGDANTINPLHLPVQGQDASGLYVLPARPARTLVVFGHGYSYNDMAWVKHMTNAAGIDGALSVTMNYRGLRDLPKDATGYPRSRGWPVAAGAQDLVAAGRYFDATCGPFDRIMLLGISMGGNSTGLAAATQAKRIDGRPLFDYWVGIEGVYNLTELYNEATLVGPTNQFAANAKSDIEAETGGTFAQVPQAYAARTVVNRAAEIAASGLKGVYLVHAVNDGQAAYNQAQEMVSSLRGNGLPTDLYSVSRHAPGDDQNIDTTLAGAPVGSAGHEAEWSTHDIVLDTGFDRLTASLIRGEPPPCNRTFAVDGMSSPQITPDPAVQAPGCPAGERVLPGVSTSTSTTTQGTGSSSGRCAAVHNGLSVVVSRRGRGRHRHHRQLLLRGFARGRACGAISARITRVSVALARPVGATGRCRFARSRGRLSRPRSCARPIYLRARLFAGGPLGSRWRLPALRTPRGRYRLTVVSRQGSATTTRLDRRLTIR